MLVVGEAGSGKTTAAFGFAVHTARSGKRVLFITQKATAEANPPFVDAYSYKLNKDILSRISMKYLKSIDELESYLASLHLWDGNYQAIVIDSLEIFLDASTNVASPMDRTQRLVRLLGLCRLTCDFFDVRGEAVDGKQDQCSLLATSSSTHAGNGYFPCTILLPTVYQLDKDRYVTTLLGKSVPLAEHPAE